MGVVYLAEQATPRRLLALKVLRDGVSGDSLTRFRREIEVLGRLCHPGIAQIHDAGVEATDAGERPWFAMEYVEGRPLLVHARAERPTPRQAVELFLQVCDAVQAAHEAGVLHRDIKPENILVGPGGRARLVDFGVARLTRSDLRAATLHTATGELVGTLAYMSPEQTAGGSEPLDARSDVYALGIVLYELLTGELPYTTSSSLVHELVRAIREEDPRPLTTHRSGLDFDLGTIVGKALEKAPARRYQSAAALAADLRRYLANEPVLARRPSAIYQLTKFARRHRGLVVGMVATFFALTAGLVTALLALGRAWRAERELEHERDALVAISDLQGIELLTQRAKTLFPATPEHVGDLEQWLAEALPIAGRLDEHRADLAASERCARAGEALAADPGEDFERLRRLVAALEGFTDLDRGVLPEIEGRLEFARALEQRTIGDHAETWERAISAIAEPEGPYRGLVITPQLGLVPLGPDPGSELWEFGYYGATGRTPERDELGNLRIGEESGLVFVLLPGATYTQGRPFLGPAFPPHTDDYEGPVREVTLAPFFLSKYEMTQGQWLRVASSNPSQHEVGTTFGGITTTALHPAEFISWLEAAEMMERLDLTLPTEAQWEFAVRAGTSTTFWTGDEPSTLVCAANLTPLPPDPEGPLAVRLQDAWEIHAPVGSFLPNPFGLHDMLGNVKEWCLDPWFGHYHQLPLRPGDGLVAGPGDGHFAIRGGSFGGWWPECRSAHRTDGRDAWRQPWVGVRPARALR
jgi:formylglycine-generating enzyme required for sulfatase activity